MSSLQNIKDELTSIAENIEVPTDEIKTPAEIFQCLQNSNRMRAYVTSSFFAGINILYIIIITFVLMTDQTPAFTKEFKTTKGVTLYTKNKDTLDLSKTIKTVNLYQFFTKYLGDSIDITSFRILVVVVLITLALLITLLDRSVTAANHEIEEQYQCQEHQQSSKDVYGLISTFFACWVIIVCAFVLNYTPIGPQCSYPRTRFTVLTFPIFFTIYTITLLTAFGLSVEGDINNSINC